MNSEDQESSLQTLAAISASLADIRTLLVLCVREDGSSFRIHKAGSVSEVLGMMDVAKVSIKRDLSFEDWDVKEE